MQKHSAHLKAITNVALYLSKLPKTQFVFTGGAIVGLLLTDQAMYDVRPTDDVDVIASITRYSDFASLQEELRNVGFEHDMNGPNCRFVLHGLKVDVMPTDGSILGFTNRWYDLAVRSAEVHVLPNDMSIRVISAPVFIATKLEAFNDRGQGDFMLSHDLEDIITVVNGRPELIHEVERVNAEVCSFIVNAFALLVDDRNFLDAIAMQLLPDEGSQARAKIIVERLRAISELRSRK